MKELQDVSQVFLDEAEIKVMEVLFRWFMEPKILGSIPKVHQPEYRTGRYISAQIGRTGADEGFTLWFQCMSGRIHVWDESCDEWNHDMLTEVNLARCSPLDFEDNDDSMELYFMEELL